MSNHADAHAHDMEVDKEIASAGRALFIAAFTIIVGSAAVAGLTFMLRLKF